MILSDEIKSVKRQIARLEEELKQLLEAQKEEMKNNEEKGIVANE